MKKLFTTLSLFLLLNIGMNAQVVINEIFYNVPGAGEDEEFVELHNAGSAAVSLQGYTIRDMGASTVLGNINIPAGGYIVLGKDSTIFNGSFGMYPDAVFAIVLSNSGEYIVLENNMGTIIDSVFYDDNSPWTTDADGLGYSLQLCDASTDNNDGNNWGTSMNIAGYNNQDATKAIYATPRAANTCSTPTFPLYTIAQINGVNANGVADSVNVRCQLKAIAYCNNNRASGGYDFAFANSNNIGIRFFSYSDVNNYSFNEGDSLHVWGTIAQYNGLLQFRPDSIVVLAQGIATPNPMVVTAPSENTENKYIELMGVHLVDAAAWTGTGSGFNVYVTTGGADTTLVRIDNDVDLYSQSAPVGSFDISGWGSQYDFSSPFDDAYQLIPCGSLNITGTEAIQNNSDLVNVYPNPAQTELNIQSELNIESIQVYNTLGQLVFNQMNINTTATQINTTSLENGVYIIAIQTENSVMTQQVQILK